MIHINLNKLRNLNLRSNHNHSGEYGDYTWEVIEWNKNEEYRSKYDYKVSFKLKFNGRPMGTHMFYGVDSNGKLLKASVNWVIHHSIAKGKRPPRTDLMQPSSI